MKIQSLKIDSYKHLQDVTFDFTYPEGHAKAGKILSKVCLIGQSATGKTSILELIKKSCVELELTNVYKEQLLRRREMNFAGTIEYFIKDDHFKITQDFIVVNGKKFLNLGSGGGAVTDLVPTGLKLLYLSTEIISKDVINIFNQNPLSVLNELPSEKYSNLQLKFKSPNYVYEFGQEVSAEIWFSLLYKILDYRKRFHQMASELLNKGAIGDLGKLNNQYAKWSEANKNPLISFSEHFNPVLKKLNLEIDVVNTEYPIPIKSIKNDEIIPVASLSTGTKGLLLTMFPLFELDTTDNMILLDEPERSLFPDMQIDLMEIYQNLAPQAQFIVATHSPFIAASFEPEERFILYFNKNGKVAVRRGESPIGDDPNDILTNDFQVSYYNDFGKQAYKKYVDLKRDMSVETEPNKKKELLIELTELGDKYNF